MNEEEIQASLDQYVELFKAAQVHVGQDAAVAIVEQVGKHLRVAQMRNGSGGKSGFNGGSNGDQPATEKQLRYLDRLDIQAPKGITKKRASDLIDEVLKD